MVQYLAGVVEDGAGGCFGNYFFQRHTLELAAWQQLIQIIYVCLKVFAVVKRQCLCADDRLKSIELVWEVYKCKHICVLRCPIGVGHNEIMRIGLTVRISSKPFC